MKKIKWTGNDTLIRNTAGKKVEVKKGGKLEVTDKTCNDLKSSYGSKIEILDEVVSKKEPKVKQANKKEEKKARKADKLIKKLNNAKK